MHHITSRTSAEIKAIAKLHIKKHRDQEKLFIAEGKRACTTLIASDIRLKQLYITDKSHRSLAPKSTTLVDNHVMEKISTAHTPSGVLGVFHIPAQPAPSSLTPGIVLASIKDPGNAGTLIRTATAMGAQSVVFIDAVDAWSPKVIQASAGTIGNITLFDWSWDTLMQNKKNLQLTALVVDGGITPDALDKNKTLLVVGSEAHGIPAEWQSACDTQITLAMPGKIESLNAAVAGSIALYTTFK